LASFKTKKVADFFLTESHPYSKKRSIKIWHVASVFAVIVVVVLLIGTYLDNQAEKERAIKQARLNAERRSEATTEAHQTSSNSQSYLPTPLGSDQFRGASVQRQRSATQIIKRGDSPSDVLPMGTLVRVRLLGKVESTDSNSPVSAVVIEDAKSPADYTVIPRGAKVIGQGQLDQSRERLQVHFATIVYPEGEQFSITAIAAMPDGSSGVAGDFSSGAFRRHASQFVGNFVGGMAEGMEDRTTGGGMGIPFEPGSLKNGALNGIAQSSLEYAKSTSQEMGQSSASISIPPGQEFVLYLEREFHQ
jgi:type IV secretory pathway VirB10-like protein